MHKNIFACSDYLDYWKVNLWNSLIFGMILSLIHHVEQQPPISLPKKVCSPIWNEKHVLSFIFFSKSSKCPILKFETNCYGFICSNKELKQVVFINHSWMFPHFQNVIGVSILQHNRRRCGKSPPLLPPPHPPLKNNNNNNKQKRLLWESILLLLLIFVFINSINITIECICKSNKFQYIP